jgi:hypothetical protein
MFNEDELSHPNGRHPWFNAKAHCHEITSLGNPAKFHKPHSGLISRGKNVSEMKLKSRGMLKRPEPYDEWKYNLIRYDKPGGDGALEQNKLAVWLQISSDLSHDFVQIAISRSYVVADNVMQGINGDRGVERAVKADV